MKWKNAITVTLVLTCVLVLAGADQLRAQAKERTDLTGRGKVGSDEIVRGLTRGIKPQLSAAPAPATQPVAAPTVAISVLFASGSDAISPEAAENLNSVGNALKSPQLTAYRIRIEGHTDSVGSDAYNLDLSERRARSVKRYLTRNFGVESDRLVTVGRGEQEPVDSNATAEGRQRNRRVEFVNIGAR